MSDSDRGLRWPDDTAGDDTAGAGGGAGAGAVGGRPARPFTLVSLAVSVAVCVAWYVAVVIAYFAYASGQSDAVAASGCTGADCPSQRTALLTLGYFGLLPTSLVSLLASLVVLVFAARRLRVPVVLGTVSALAGMVLGAIGFITIATYDLPTG